MAKFNQNNTIKTTNISGVPAYSMGLKEKLVTQVLTTFFAEPKYYGDNSVDIVQNVRELLGVDAEFVAKLAMFVRKEMHLRTISHVLVTELANHVNGKPYARKAIHEVVERVDDMTEIMSYQFSVFGKPIPASMKKGIADAFVKFDEYQLAKYNRKGAVKLKDVLSLVHPKPKDEAHSNMWKRIFTDELETPVTWETELSAKGNTQDVWESLIAENKLGYMALLRNLRNMLQANVRNMDKVYETLSDERRVLNSKQLPFRFYSAYKSVEDIGTSKVFDALELAIRASTKNIERFPGKTLIAADVSGSMSWGPAGKSKVKCSEIATLLMSIANYICDESITVTFDTDLYLCNLSTMNGILANARSIPIDGGGTDITLPLRYIINNKIHVDRIIMLSDNEINTGWDTGRYYGDIVTCQSLVDQYRREINPDVWVHAIDLQGYGTQQFHGRNTNVLAGWSERILEFISTSEKGTETLIGYIEKYE